MVGIKGHLGYLLAIGLIGDGEGTALASAGNQPVGCRRIIREVGGVRGKEGFGDICDSELSVVAEPVDVTVGVGGLTVDLGRFGDGYRAKRG